MIIIGIDPALTKTGWGVISSNQNNISFISCGTICTDPEQSLDQRLHHLYQETTKIINKYNPQQMAIEETFVNKNAISSLKLGHARGALMLSGAIHNLEIFEYASTAIKKTIVGIGRAQKHQVSAMIKYLLPQATYKNNDEADALAVAICHNNNRRIVV